MNEYMVIKKHTHVKHTILKKYLGACKRFSEKYRNFIYIDTHGGTGAAIDEKTGTKVDGSVLTAAKIFPSYPSFVVEIDPDRYSVLEECTKKLENINLYCDDCNDIIEEIFNNIEAGRYFVFCFIDPDGLSYKREGIIKHQMKWETIDIISKFPRTEVLINFPVRAVMGHVGTVKKSPKNKTSRIVKEYLNQLFGSEQWNQIEPGKYRKFVRLYIEKRLERYKYKGAFLVRADYSRGPQYYLIYGSNSEVGANIMRDIMKVQWREIYKTYPLTRNQYDTDKAWLDAEYPYSKFIFETN